MFRKRYEVGEPVNHKTSFGRFRNHATSRRLIQIQIWKVIKKRSLQQYYILTYYLRYYLKLFLLTPLGSHYTALFTPSSVTTNLMFLSKYLQHIPGSIEIIISIPHGGNLSPSWIPNRRCFCGKTDHEKCPVVWVRLRNFCKPYFHFIILLGSCWLVLNGSWTWLEKSLNRRQWWLHHWSWLGNCQIHQKSMWPRTLHNH